MRVLLASEHRYRVERGEGVGRRVRAEPSGAPQLIHDLIARGLAELGHEVFYQLAHGAADPLPAGVTLVGDVAPAVDVGHNVAPAGRPWIRTIHRAMDEAERPVPDQWVFVSRSLARFHRARRFVWNGLDPDAYVFQEKKDDYVLFLSSMQGNRTPTKYRTKGIEVALALRRRLGFPLVVAGTAKEPAALEQVAAMCRRAGADFVGDVRGRRKAALLAGARALLFPTQAEEGFGLVLAEALMSGTPVVASARGACPEIVDPAVGFVCHRLEDYAAALDSVAAISPRACRERALRCFHYRVMAAGYVAEYQRAIRAFEGGGSTPGASRGAGAPGQR